MHPNEGPVLVIGAGPAGLTAAYELTRRQHPVIVLERDGQVGGLARTIVYRGFRFDIGGHRFFTKVEAVEALWRELLGDDLLKRPRLSRIYYQGRFFHYPLRAGNALANLGVRTSLGVLASYVRATLSPIRPEVSFEDWVCNRFGRRLFELFFKSYTEKVWGMPCSRIGAQWAAQRIKGLSLRTAAMRMIDPRRPARGNGIRTFIHAFDYPRLGPGMMWEACRDRVVERGGRVELDAAVVEIQHEGDRVTAVAVDREGTRRVQPVAHLISTMPLRHLIERLSPQAPPAVQRAAARLKYRDFLTVVLIADQAEVFPDNWIYVHDPSVRVGRVQNFKNWSPEMVPDARWTCLGLEYFCTEDDDLWTMDDEALLALAAREVAAIGLLSADKVTDGVVVRVPKAYPVYDDGYLDALATVRAYLDQFANLQVVGRNGMHKYNNQDHSMFTAMLAVRNLFGERHDLWAMNADDEYHELARDAATGTRTAMRASRALATTQPLVPQAIPSHAPGDRPPARPEVEVL